MRKNKYGTLLEAQSTFSPFNWTHLFLRSENGTTYLDRDRAIAEAVTTMKLSEEVASVRFVRVLIHQFGGVADIFTNPRLTYYLEVRGDRIFGGVYNPDCREKVTNVPVVGYLEGNTSGCKYRCVFDAYKLLVSAIAIQ